MPSTLKDIPGIVGNNQEISGIHKGSSSREELIIQDLRFILAFTNSPSINIFVSSREARFTVLLN